MRRLAISITLALIAGLLTGPSFAPAVQAADPVPAGVVQGTITEAETGAALPGACAHVYDAQWQETAVACADAAGKYATPQLPLATYRIKFTAAGHADSWHSLGTTVQFHSVFTANLLNLTATAGVTSNAKLRAHHGTIKGTLADTTGRRFGMLYITAYAGTGTTAVAITRSRADGSFEFPGLAPGDYRFQFSGYCVGQQFIKDATGAPATFAVTDGATTNADYTHPSQTCSVTGVFQGKVADATTGAALPDAPFRLVVQPYNFEVASGVSGADGAYRVEGIIPFGVGYRIQASAAGYPMQWANGGMTMSAGGNFQPSATEIPLSAKFGTLRGRVTDPSGQPVAATVSIIGAGKSMGTLSQVTGPDGLYSFPGVVASTWRLRVVHPTLGTQWYDQVPGTSEAATTAPTISVAADPDTVVDQQYAERSHLVVTVLDDRTGLPVTDACLTVGNSFTATAPKVCGSGDGVYRLDVPPGSMSLTATAPGMFDRYLPPINLAAGQDHAQTVRLTPGGAIGFTVRKNADGTIPGVCVTIVPDSRLATAAPEVGTGACNWNGTIRQESFTTPMVPLGRVRIFVSSLDPQLGAQWLGPQGGTGRKELAAVVEVVRGSTTAPQIKMDRAGHVYGTVGGWYSGYGTAVRPGGPETGHLAGCQFDGGFVDCTDNNSSYSLALGPYAWPLEFYNVSGAYAWSGGVPSRSRATLIQITSDEWVRYDFTNPVPGKVILSTPSGTTDWIISSYDAVTGDAGGMFSSVYGYDSLANGPLLLQAHYTKDGQRKSCWLYRTSANGHKTGVHLPGTVANPLALTPQPGVNCFDQAPSLLVKLPRREARAGVIDIDLPPRTAVHRPSVWNQVGETIARAAALATR